MPDAAEIAERRAKKKEEEFTKSAPPVVEAAKPSGSPNFRQTTSSGFLSVMGSALGKVAGKMRAGTHIRTFTCMLRTRTYVRGSQSSQNLSDIAKQC